VYGSASGTVISSGGEEIVAASDSGAIVSNGGLQVIWGGGVANGAQLLSGGTELVYGSASGTVISSGGEEIVAASDSGAIVSNGGLQVIWGGGIAYGAHILSGGTQEVYGSAVATTVSSGGFEQVFAGGAVNGATISNGELAVNSGATAEGTITFVNGGTLTLDAAGDFGAVISGFAKPDQLDLSAIAFGSGTTLSFTEASNNSSGTLTVTDGTHTDNLTLLGQYTAAQFNLASDGNGGTLVTDPPAVAMTDHNPIGVVAPRHA
jgi:autotransporter passenger strand-loop-strand repeat protein